MVNKYLKGGKSEGMTLAQVAKLHNMNAEQLKPQLKKGIKHELEHTESVTEARRIALDHLVEFPDYYDRLDKIEKMHLGGDMSKHLAPNGKPSNLTHEQWHLVRTPEFKAWFGDWENDPKNASKVVDENGEPLVVYHGSIVETNFDIFDYQKADLGFHFGTKEQAKNRVESKGVLPKRKSIVNSFFLNIRVLFEMSDAGEWQYPQRYIDELISDNIIEEKVAKQKGFLSLYSREDNAIIRDYIKSKYGSSVGFVYNNKYEGKGKSFIALSPEQIKLADGSNTTFDGNNPDIRFAKGGEIENLIDQGEIELKVYPTTPKHANLYGLKSENPLYIQTIFISENQRLKGIGKKVLKYLNDFAIENGHDVMFGHITQKASLSKDDSRESNLDDVAMIKNWLQSNGYEICEGNNDFYKVVNNPDIRFAKGGRTIAQTPAPASDRVYGSKANRKGSASDSQNAKSIKFNDALEKAIENKVDEYNEKHPSDKVSLSTAKAVVRRGMGAYSKSHRPTIGGGAPNSRQAWGLARLNKFLLKKAGVKVKSAYIQDDDLLKYEQGGEVVAKNKDIRGNLSNMDKEVKHTMGKAGGYLVGRRHSQGGIKAINKATGQPLEMEGGEVVITRNAVSDGTTREFEGEMLTNREILSRINESGGGVSFEDGGEIMASGNQYNYGGRMMTDHDILHEMALGGELDEMAEMDEIEFEYGGDVTDFKLKNKIVFPTKDIDDFYYVNIFENPEDLQIFKAQVYKRYSGRPVFKGFTKWSKEQFVLKTQYQYYDRKNFLSLIEPQTSIYGITPKTFTQIPKKSMLIPNMTGTETWYRKFASIVDNNLQNVPFQFASDARTKFEWLVGNRDFQREIAEFFDEYEVAEPNFVYQEGVKKKVTRAKKEDKFQYGVESLKFGKSYDTKPYNNKLVKNDANNSLVDLITKLIKEYFSTDINNPNAPLYENRFLDIPVKEIKVVQKTTGVEMSYDSKTYGVRNLEMETVGSGKRILLNKKQQYGVPKLIINNVEDLGGVNFVYYLFDKMGYQFNSDPITWRKWFESGIIDFNIKLSIDDYCRVVGYVLARYCTENEFPIIRPIYSIADEPLMIEDVKSLLEVDDLYLSLFEGKVFHNWLVVCVLYYRANFKSQTSKAKSSMEARIAQNLKVGDKVEISQQEMEAVGFKGLDEKGDLLRGEILAIRSVPAMRRPSNPEGNMYAIRYFVQDPYQNLKGDWEGKDLVLLEASDVVELEKPQQPQLKKPPMGKNKKPLGDKSELNRNIYDLQYLISMTSDFDFEVKMKLRQQLTEFQKLKDIIYATENSEDLIKSSTPNYDGKYAVAIIQTMLDADSIILESRPNYGQVYNDGFQPNGEQTLLDKFNYDLVQTSMFKEWFGDFTTAYDFKGLSGYDNIIPVSKVLTKGYEPLVVYQGLGMSFERERFDSFPTSYFAVNPNYAEWFATTKGQRNGSQGYVLPFFLNVRNPLDMTYFGIDKVSPKDFFDYLFVKTGQTAEQLGFDARFLQPNVPPMEIWAYVRNSPQAIESIKNQGVYDGFHFYENNPQASGEQYQTEVWTTFFSNQTKLASNQRSKMLYSANQGFLLAKGGLIKK
jgi:hypothetical protein